MSNSLQVIESTRPKFDVSIISTRKQILKDVAVQLKTEFFGIDTIIDNVISSIQAWYIFPDLITRPVIINLWGMTGVGKTQLVRRLVSLLGFHQQFVEVQMDGGSVSTNHSANSLTRILSESSIEEGAPGVLLLDEFQRFRTIDKDGNDVKLERFQDVWTLLSDGKFSADSSMFSQIEMLLAQQDYWNDYEETKAANEETAADEKPKKRARAYRLSPWEAKNLKKVSNLSAPLTEIMRWSEAEILEQLRSMRENKTAWEVDYTKLVIFISGNLDEAFTGARSAEDCDTDADYYHEITSKITSTEIKKSLRYKFKPEQISRLGNNHIIYPSLSRDSYERIIAATCDKYVREMQETSNLVFTVTDNVKQQIYDNSVYPTQGTRPVFSSIHLIFGNVLVDVAFWCIENNLPGASIDMSEDVKSVVAKCGDKSANFHVELELNKKRARATLDFKTYIAAHEAGHALAYALLTGAAPLEVKVNAASYTGGYMLPSDDNFIVTAKNVRDDICVYLAGRAAEEIIFGTTSVSNGAASDIRKATALASKYVRRWGMHNDIVYIDATYPADTNWNVDLDATNTSVRSLMKSELHRARELIKNNIDTFNKIVSEVLTNNTVSQQQFIDLMAGTMPLVKKTTDSGFSDAWLAHLGE